MTESDYLLPHVRDALAAISSPRFYATERGYQGALLSQINLNLKMSEHTLSEQEYQKRLNLHGLKIRPDIVIHEPFDSARHENRIEGNYAVIELKLNANENDAKNDFDKLALMIEVLKYQLGIFVNINSRNTFIEKAPKHLSGKIFSFAVELSEGKVHIVQAGV